MTMLKGLTLIVFNKVLLGALLNCAECLEGEISYAIQYHLFDERLKCLEKGRLLRLLLRKTHRTSSFCTQNGEEKRGYLPP
jgi:hypothetical protein